MRLALIHSQQPGNQYAGGPTGQADSEQAWMRRLALQVAPLLTAAGVEVEVSPLGTSYASNVAWVNGRHKAQPFDLLVSFHSNAAGDSCILYGTSKASRAYAEKFQRALNAAKIVPAGDGWEFNERKVAEVADTAPPAVLLEWHRHDTTAGAAWLRQRINDGTLAADATRAILDALGVKAPAVPLVVVKPTAPAAPLLTVDGDLGPATVTALQRLVGATADGVWGPETTRKLQEYLNRTLTPAAPQTPATPAPAPAGVDVRVVTCNVLSTRFSDDWTSRRATLVADLAKVGAGVILLQEAAEAQRDYIRAGLPGGADRWKVWAHRESAVVFDSTRWQHDAAKVVRVDVKSTSYHGAVGCTLTDRKSGRPAAFVSLHLSPSKMADDALQKAQLADVLARTKGLAADRIVGGDFNDKQAPTWATGYANARTGTASTHDGGGTIDHLLSAGRVFWRGFTVRPTAGSDHHIVYADATITPTADTL